MEPPKKVEQVGASQNQTSSHHDHSSQETRVRTFPALIYIVLTSEEMLLSWQVRLVAILAIIAHGIILDKLESFYGFFWCILKCSMVMGIQLIFIHRSIILKHLVALGRKGIFTLF